MSKNPYIFGPLIQDKAMFFGRQRELARLRDCARKGISVALVGLRRMGKSSLLYQFTHQTGSRADHVVIAYLDLHDSSCHTVSGLLTAALKELDKQLNHRYRFGLINTIEAFIEAVEQMGADGYRPVLCLDEIEELINPSRGELNDFFFKTLPDLASHSKLTFVTASRSALFTNIFTQLNLIGLTDTDAQTLLTAPFRRAALRIPPPRQKELAIKLAGHHPYFLQLAGSLLWEDSSINHEHYRQQFAKRARLPLKELWQQLTADEQAAAIKLASGVGAQSPHWEKLKHLWTIGIAEKNDRGKYHFFSELLAEWIISGEWEEMMNQPVEDDFSQKLIERHDDWLRLLWQRCLSFVGIKNN